MKILKNILYLFAITLVVVSCDTNDEVTGYDSTSELYNYEFVPKGDYTVAIDAASVTETSFNVVATSTESGTIFYMISDASATAPSNEAVHAAGNSIDITENSTATFNVDGGALFAPADFTVYTVFKNEGNFISESISSLSQSLTGCPTTGGVYNAQPNAFDVDQTPFTVTLTPTGNANEFSLDTTWGANLVADLTGDRQYIDQFLYPSILKINDDLSVTVTTTDDSTLYTGGSGTYTLCDDVIEVTLTQGIFTNPFTVNVTFTR